jgi:hypothetical protein
LIKRNRVIQEKVTLKCQLRYNNTNLTEGG